MPESMSISVNGQSQVPPGFRFHPTEEELLQYYLRKKVSFEKIDLDVIREVDLNKLEPWDIQERCKIGTTPQNDWYFFSHKDKKYPTGTRTNRATAAGFWKATGRDKVIYSNSRRIGMRKTLVFYKGRAPHGQKSDWIMHEYRLDDNTNDSEVPNVLGDETMEDGWVVCRIFKKKNQLKTLDTPVISSSSLKITDQPRSHMYGAPTEGSLEQILHYSMGRSININHHQHHQTSDPSRFLPPVNTFQSFHDTFMKLPTLDSPNSTCSYTPVAEGNEASIADIHQVNPPELTCNYPTDTGLASWAALDRLVASQLNGGQSQAIGYGGPAENDGGLQSPAARSSSLLISHASSGDVDLWNLTKSSSSSLSSSSVDPFCHVVNASV